MKCKMDFRHASSDAVFCDGVDGSRTTVKKRPKPACFVGFHTNLMPVLCQKMQNRNALFMRFVDRATNKCKMKCKMKFDIGSGA